MINEILQLFEKWGRQNYDENISQLEHALQCAALAEKNGSSTDLIIAALLHDIGHLIQLESKGGTWDFNQNDDHESAGARYLASGFGPGVTAPIALHVQAKRYLCAVESTYLDTLSQGSIQSLALQGGPMDVNEVQKFEAMPSFQATVLLRRWDEAGKVLNLEVASLEHYLPMMELSLTSR